MTTQRVLFLCTGNSARSQMAEAFLRKYAGEHFEAYSAGLKPKQVNPFTIQVMQEAGIDISNQISKGIETYLEPIRKIRRGASGIRLFRQKAITLEMSPNEGYHYQAKKCELLSSS